MKILVVSDSHGDVAGMLTCVDMLRPRHILFLGDGLRDADEVHERFPDIPMDTVAGNCDLGRREYGEKLIEIEGHRILMMHGHTRNVKNGLLEASYAAREAGAQILLYGHTHCSRVERNGDFWIMNPGSIGNYPRSYGVLTIEGKTVDCSVYRL